MEKRTALVFGSTGLVGNLLVEELKACGKYSSIKIFVRNAIDLAGDNVEQVVTDFGDIQKLRESLTGDDIFICLGTTIKKAGSVENMEKIDRDLPVMIAGEARKAGARRIAVVSSIGADPKSRNYYLRIKGEMEEGIIGSSYERTVIVRPSMLMGDRKEKRPGETAGKIMMKIFNPVLTGKLLKFRSIHGRDVAKAMIALIDRENDKLIYESDELQRTAAEK